MSLFTAPLVCFISLLFSWITVKVKAPRNSICENTVIRKNLSNHTFIQHIWSIKSVSQVWSRTILSLSNTLTSYSVWFCWFSQGSAASALSCVPTTGARQELMILHDLYAFSLSCSHNTFDAALRTNVSFWQPIIGICLAYSRRWVFTWKLLNCAINRRR